jgi:hypothetical protein
VACRTSCSSPLVTGLFGVGLILVLILFSWKLCVIRGSEGNSD